MRDGKTGSYPGNSQCVLVVLLIIGIVNHYPMKGFASIRSTGMIKDHHSGLPIINDNKSG